MRIEEVKELLLNDMKSVTDLNSLNDLKVKYLTQSALDLLAKLSRKVPDDYGKKPAGRSNTGNSGRRHRSWKYHILPSAEHS